MREPHQLGDGSSLHTYAQFLAEASTVDATLEVCNMCIRPVHVQLRMSAMRVRVTGCAWPSWLCVLRGARVRACSWHP